MIFFTLSLVGRALSVVCMLNFFLFVFFLSPCSFKWPPPPPKPPLSHLVSACLSCWTGRFLRLSLSGCCCPLSCPLSLLRESSNSFCSWRKETSESQVLQEPEGRFFQMNLWWGGKYLRACFLGCFPSLVTHLRCSHKLWNNFESAYFGYFSGDYKYHKSNLFPEIKTSVVISKSKCKKFHFKFKGTCPSDDTC